METLYEHAGGEEGLRHFVEVFYGHVLTDPLLSPLFGAGKPEHIPVLTAFESEAFGGPDRFTKEMGGFQRLIDVHRHLNISEEQRQRFIELYMSSLDEAGMPDDPPFRQAIREHVVFGTEVAVQNSHARTEAELHPLREVPIWNWPDEVSKPAVEADS